MTKKKTSIITLLIVSMLLSACSIGKKNHEEPESLNLTVEAEQNKVKEENKNNIEETVDNDFKESVEPKEDRLVLPEVEVEGYGDTKSGE